MGVCKRIFFDVKSYLQRLFQVGNVIDGSEVSHNVIVKVVKINKVIRLSGCQVVVVVIVIRLSGYCEADNSAADNPTTAQRRT
jgi:hypothetical protein